MPFARGALPRYTSEVPRQQGVPHRTAEGWILGAPLRVQKRTVHELSWMHNDLLTLCEKERPLLHCGATPAIIAGRGGLVRLRSGRLPRSQHCSQSLDLLTSLHKAPRARWIIGWDLWDFITLSIIVEHSGIPSADCRSFPLDNRETTGQFG